MLKERTRLFDGPDWWYEDYDQQPFYRDHDLTDLEFKQAVKGWQTFAKDATRSQIHQLIAENNDESLPVFVALKPILDRRDDLSRRKAAEKEKLAAWNGSKQSQRTTMIKRRSKNKQAVDYIKDEKAFLRSLKKKP